MEIDDRSGLLKDLKQQLWKLDCLARPTREAIIRFAEERLSTARLKGYLADWLPGFHWFAKVDHEGYRQCCRRLSPIEDPRTLMAELGLPGKWRAEAWLEFASCQGAEPVKRLYCLANHFAFLCFTEMGQTLDGQVMFMVMVSETLTQLKKAAVAIRLLSSLISGSEADSIESSAKNLREDLLDRVKLDTAYLWFVNLAHALMEANHPEGVLILNRDFVNALQLQTMPGPEEIQPNLLAMLYGVVAHALKETKGPQAALEYLEPRLQLQAPDYASRAALETKLGRSLGKLEAVIQAGLVLILSECLHLAGRDQNNLLVFEVLLGLNDDDYQSMDALEKKLRSRLADFGATYAVQVVSALARVWGDVGRLNEAAWILDAYPTWIETAQKREEVAADAQVGFLAQEGQILCAEGKYAQAVALLVPRLDLEGADYSRNEDLATRLQHSLAGLQPEGAARLVAQFCIALRGTRGFGRVVNVLECYLDLKSSDYLADDLAKTLRDKARAKGISPNAVTNLVMNLVDCLTFAGRSEDAAKLLKACVELAFWLRGGIDGSLPPENLSGLFARWLDFFGKEERESALEACRWLVRYLRDSVSRRGLSQDDHQRFMEHVAELRQRIVTVGYYWVEKETNPDHAVELSREALCWDVELNQIAAEAVQKVGVEEAIRQHGFSIPSALSNDYAVAVNATLRYQHQNDLAALDEAVAARQRILDDPAFARSGPGFRLDVLTDAGNTWLKRYNAYKHAADLDAAVDVLQRAVELAPNEALFGNNLCIALYRKFEACRGIGDLDTVITTLQRIVKLTPEGSPELAGRLTSLSNALSIRGKHRSAAGNRDAGLADTMAAYTVSRRATELPGDDTERAQRLSNLSGDLLKICGDVGVFTNRDVASAALNEAMSGLQRAVELMPKYSPDRVQLLINVGIGHSIRFLLTRVWRWSDKAQRGGDDDVDLAFVDLDKAIDAWRSARDWLHGVILSSPEATGLAAKATAITESLVLAHIQRNAPGAAVGELEAGKALGLRLELTRTHRRPRIGEEAMAEWRQKICELREVLSQRRELAQSEPTKHPEHSASQRLTELAEKSSRYRELFARVKELEAPDPAFGIDPPNYATLRDLAAKHDITIAYLQPTDLGTVAILIHPQSPADNPAPLDVFTLESLTRAEVGRLLFQVPEGLDPQRDDDPAALLAAARDGHALGWMKAYRLSTSLSTSVGWADRSLAEKTWRRTMKRVLSELSCDPIGPLARRLRELRTGRVHLVPGGGLALLPLHAVPFAGGPDGAACFGDEFIVSYVPSGAALRTCLERAVRPREDTPTLVAVANPDGSLVYSRDEVDRIAARFAPSARHIAHGPEATPTWLFQHSGFADFLELSMHGQFSPGNPAFSRFILAHPNGYTALQWKWAPDAKRRPLANLLEECHKVRVNDILGGQMPLKEGGCVTAAICESGQVDPRAEHEESVGFPGAFLGAGASSVIASLWAVDDLSTALLMDRVYELMLSPNSLPPAVALQRAARDLRGLPRYKVVAPLREHVTRLKAEQDAAQRESPKTYEQAEQAQRLDVLESRLHSLEEGPDFPFSHPEHWAAFAAHGA